MTTDTTLIDALRRGDADAFRHVVMEYHPALVRTARRFVRDNAAAEEVTQETWLAVIRMLGSFEERSSFKTWLFAILTNQARSRRSSDLRHAARDPAFTSVDASWFQGHDDDEPGHWLTSPADWARLPETQLLGAETSVIVRDAIDQLPSAQRQVITLRDIEGFTAAEASEVLDITDGNQRVLLHRARSRVRGALEAYFEGAATV